MSDPDPGQQQAPDSPVSSEGATNLFLCIPEGRGGTYAFGEQFYKTGNAVSYIDGTYRIGTIFCTTCVGFYFQISRGRCFVTHLNAWTHVDHPANAIDPEGGAEIRAKVRERLLNEYRRRQWDIRDESFAEQIVVCCPAPESQYDGRKKLDRVVRRTGYYVCAAIGDFLGFLAEEMNKEAQMIKSSGEKGAMAEAVELESRAELLHQRLEHFEILWYHGFIVDQEDGEAVLTKVMELLPEDDLRMSNKSPPADMGDWQPFWLPRSQTEDWNFSTDDDRAKLLESLAKENKPAEISSIVARKEELDHYGSDRITELQQATQQLNLGAKSDEVQQKLSRKPNLVVMNMSETQRLQSVVDVQPALPGPSIQVSRQSRAASAGSE